jgi:hypothetical protein
MSETFPVTVGKEFHYGESPPQIGGKELSHQQSPPQIAGRNCRINNRLRKLREGIVASTIGSANCGKEFHYGRKPQGTCREGFFLWKAAARLAPVPRRLEAAG